MAGIINFIKRAFLIAILAGLLNAVVAYFQLIDKVPKSITTIHPFVTDIVRIFENHQIRGNEVVSSIVVVCAAATGIKSAAIVNPIMCVLYSIISLLDVLVS